MSRKWISFFLAAVMTLSLAAPALAAEGQEAPPPVETDMLQTAEAAPMADVPVPEQEAAPEAETVPETAPVAGEVPEEVVPETAPEAEAPETAAAFPVVTVELTGAVDQIENIYYDAPDGSQCGYNEISGGTGMDQVKVIDGFYQSVGQVDAVPGTLEVMPDSTVRFYLNADCDLSVENGTVTDNYVHSTPAADGELISFRGVDITAPADGVMTVTVTGSDQPAPTTIPYTFYNYKWYDEDGGIVGGGSVIDGPEEGKQYAFSGDGWIMTGGSFEVWTAPGYEIQVLEGGSIVEQRAPTGPAAADVPAGSTCFVLRVDVDASQFVIAAVKQGETFAVPEEHPATGTFKDVPDDSWYKDIVEAAYASGMVSGTSADTFSPKAAASRGDTVAMLYREAGCPSLDCPVTFGDLTAEYYQDAVKWAVGIGAVQGVSQGQFAPDQAVTRQQLAAMLYRMAGQPGIWAGGMMEDYADASSIADYARGPMQWALDNGIIKGYGDGTIRPNATATRAEVCAMLTRYNELVGRFPAEPVVTEAETEPEAEPESTPAPTSAPVKHTGRNLDNPKLIAPKRDKIDDGLYSNDETADQFYQQWAETLWGLDRSGEDIMWCTRYLTRLRSGPGEQYDVVWTVNENNEVSRLGPDENGWTPVVYHQYVTSEGFTGWDYTGYLPTKYLTDQKPGHPTVQPTTGPELEAWFNYGMDAPVPEGYGMEYLERMEKENPFQFQEYEPASIDGSTYTYKISGGGTVRIHNVVPEGLARVSTSERVKDDTLSVSIMVERGYGINGPSGFMSNNLSINPWGCGLTQSTDYSKCWVTGGAELNRGEDVDFYMTSGDEAPRVLQVSAKNTAGGLRMAEACHQFIMLDKDGNPPDSYMDFFNLWNGYKLKSLSPYVTIGKVENELHYFKVSQVPAGIDQVFVEVTR